MLCSGLDGVNRGYETHTRILFENLKLERQRQIKVMLFKGSGQRANDEIVLPTPRRGGSLCRFLARFRGDRLYWEYLFFCLAFLARSFLLRERYDVVASIEPMAAKTIRRLRWLMPGRPRLTYTHGVWMAPADYLNNADCIHEVNIENYDRAVDYVRQSGAEREVVCIPHFLPDLGPPRHDGTVTRASLGLSTRYVVLTVGIVDSVHKRTDHVAREVAMLGPDWSLLACGTPLGPDGERVSQLARELLGHRFVNISLPRERMAEIYPLCDFCVLGSLNEGFGLVLLEGMRAGRPVIAHDRPLFRWILGDCQSCVDMSVAGALANRLARLAERPTETTQLGDQNRQEFMKRFTWTVLRGSYLAMLCGDPLKR